MPAPDVANFKRKLTYEATGPLPVLEEDLAHIRGMDLKAQSLKWTRWLIPLPLPVMVLIAMAAKSNSASPVLAGSGVVLVIVLWVAVSRLLRFDVENRRYEFANGLLRLLELQPNAPVRVGLVLTELESSSKVVGRSGSWTYYRDPWFFAEGQLADGVHFHYGRTSYFDSYYHSVTTRSGNRRITRTTTKKNWHFDDALTLHYDPARFPEVAQLGPAARERLKLPPGFELKHFENAPGKLSLVVHCGFKWDAVPSGATKGAIDAMSLAGLLFLNLAGVLGTTPQVDVGRAKALPPPRAIAPKAPLTPREMALVGVSGAIGVAAAGFLLAGYFHFGDAARNDRWADDYIETIKRAQACRARPGANARTCDSPEQEQRMRAQVKDRRDDAEDDFYAAIAFSVVGGVLTLASAGGFLFWRSRRRKWIADAEAAGAETPGLEAAPPLEGAAAPQGAWAQPASPGGPQQGAWAQPASPGQPQQGAWAQPASQGHPPGQPPGGPQQGAWAQPASQGQPQSGPQQGAWAQPPSGPWPPNRT